MRALVVVDVQNDFCEGGAVAVEGGSALAETIRDFLGADAGYAFVVATRDAHIDPGDHFSAQPDFATSWPPHCRVGTPGAQLHPALDGVVFDAVFDKGAYDAGYSGFGGHDNHGTGLENWLRERGIDRVDVVGIALDHCVRWTASDAAGLGFSTRVLVDLTAGVGQASTATALDALTAAGVSIASSAV